MSSRSSGPTGIPAGSVQVIAQPGDEVLPLKSKGAYGAMPRALPNEARVFARVQVNRPDGRLERAESRRSPNPNWDRR